MACDKAGVRGLAIFSMLACASPAFAAEVTVEVRTQSGAPVRDAVVSLYPGGRPAPLPAGRRSYEIAQRAIQFSPFVLVVPVGSSVAFPNFDPVRHHVYSFSAAKRFELKLYAKEQNRTVTFDKPGAVPLGCNIHDNMSAFIKVSDTAFSAKTDASGRVTFSGVPAGMTVARLWHPYLRAPGNEVELRWIFGGGRAVEQVKVALRPPPPRATAY